jgi:hypothetical protein
MIGRAAVAFVCSDLARVALALLLTLGTFALLLMGHPVPDFVIGLDGLAIGFYFGGGIVQASRSGE